MSVEEIMGELGKEVKSLSEGVNKRLEDERKAYAELLTAKAEGKAVSELEEKVAKHESATTEAMKRLENEIAELKMAQTSVPAKDNAELEEKAWLELMRKGNMSTLDEKSRNLMIACQHKYLNELGEAKKELDEVKSMYTGSNVDGGAVVVPPSIERRLIRVFEEDTAIFRIASRTNTSSPVYQIPGLTDDIDGGWSGETDPVRDTAGLKFGNVEIRVHDLLASPKISRNMLEDAAIDMDAEMLISAQRTFSRLISNASINGDGVARLRGILTYPMVNQNKVEPEWGKIGYVPTGVAGDWKAPTETVNPIDTFMDIQGILPSAYEANAAWLVNRQTATAMRKFKNKDGAYMWETSVKVGEPATFLGAPVYYDYNLPSASTRGFPVLYGDFFSAYRFVLRRGMTVIRDLTNPKWVKIHFTMRIGAGVRDFNAIKAIKADAN